MTSSTREGLHACGTGKESDPYESAFSAPPWVLAASKCSATASADPKQRGCSLLALVAPKDLAHRPKETGHTAWVVVVVKHVLLRVILGKTSHAELVAGMYTTERRHALHSLETCCMACITAHVLYWTSDSNGNNQNRANSSMTSKDDDDDDVNIKSGSDNNNNDDDDNISISAHA